MSECVKLIKEKRLFDGNCFDIVERKFSLLNKSSITKEIIIAKPVSVILPVLDSKHIILVEQYRYGIKENLLELPAGTIKDTEAPLACAKREIEEETGYKANTWRKYSSFYSSPGLNNELVHLFAARELIKTEMKLDYDEILKPVIMDKDRISSLIIDGYIKDAKTLIGLLIYYNFKDQKKNF
jgi:ADP-ribose pyrophosphatase